MTIHTKLDVISLLTEHSNMSIESVSKIIVRGTLKKNGSTRPEEVSRSTDTPLSGG
jgi:hypothetical protein